MLQSTAVGMGKPSDCFKKFLKIFTVLQLYNKLISKPNKWKEGAQNYKIKNERVKVFFNLLNKKKYNEYDSKNSYVYN